MVLVIILAILAIIGMFLCIFRFPTIRIGHFAIDTFYLPILFVAIVLLVFPTFDKTDFFEVLSSNTNLNPLKILVLFICISFLSIALDETGFFHYIATVFIEKFKASQYKLFFSLYLLISILTIFTSNDIVILTFTPFILYFSKHGKINPIPYLVMEFVAANTYSMFLSIGNPTNIYLASVFEIPFLDYALKMLLPALVCGLSTLLVIFFLFKKELKKPIELFELNESRITNKPLCIICVIHLALTTILLAISNYINMEVWLICLAFASSLLLILFFFSILKKDVSFIEKPIRRVPYSLIPFILSMFTIIMALDSYEVFGSISSLFNQVANTKLEAIIYLVTSTLSCNVMNNIPMTLAYGSILANTNELSFVYATIMGSNIGALLTPVGALAGIMWLKILKINKVDYSFAKFMKNGVLITAAAMVACMICLLFF